MTKELFSSPREDALEIAYQTRKAILTGKSDPVAILRACLVIAQDLAKKSAIEWINQELSGYKPGEVPHYRVHSCRVVSGIYQNVGKGFQEFKLPYPAHYLLAYSRKNQDMTIVLAEENNVVLYVTPNKIESTLAAIVDRCLQFLGETITELQYGGIVEFLMEEIRRKTDEKLATYDPKITEETQSLYLSLTSTNPADWSKVGHSCRKILKLLADSVFPPCDEKYNAKDGRVLEVTEPCFINRLYAFLDKNSTPDEKKFLGAQIDYLESYLRQVVNYAQMAEHNPSIEKFHANLLAIHTYLVISSVLRHVPDKLSD
jgi:hypothetical protein